MGHRPSLVDAVLHDRLVMRDRYAAYPVGGGKGERLGRRLDRESVGYRGAAVRASGHDPAGRGGGTWGPGGS